MSSKLWIRYELWLPFNYILSKREKSGCCKFNVFKKKTGSREKKFISPHIF